MAIHNFIIFSRNVLPHLKKIHNKQFYSEINFSTFFGNKKFQKRPVKLMFAAVPAIGLGYYFLSSNKPDDGFIQKGAEGNFSTRTVDHQFLTTKPKVPIARSVNKSQNDWNLSLTLFQYPTCPFCCKVRAFLDYYGLPYEVVEVNPVFRQQTSWTTYKKVPILLAKVKEGYQQLNDSSMIVSALKTYLINKDRDLEEIVNYYPVVEYVENNGEVKLEVVNKYFLMYKDDVPKNKTSKVIMEEKKWREWADKELVHTLSPNVYRTTDEALQAFKWFSEVGEWDKLFPAWERNVIVYVGAFAMWMISKNLKKRHRLKDDVRESLYDSCRKWTKKISEKNSKFLGGDSPNLGDLAVYGVLSSIEGCLAFKDLLENTNIGEWYYSVKEAINNHQGKQELLQFSAKAA